MTQTKRTAREFIWERCEADDYKTDEIMAFLRGLILAKKATRSYSKNLETHEKVNAFNQALDELAEEFK